MGKQSKGYEREKIELADMEVEFKRSEKDHKNSMQKHLASNRHHEYPGFNRVVREHIELLNKINYIRYTDFTSRNPDSID